MYRSIQVSEGDQVSSVLRLAMQKHGVQGDPAHYCLELLTDHESEYMFVIAICISSCGRVPGPSQIEYENSRYSTVSISSASSTAGLPLPMDANLYYALSDHSSTLVLTPKNP